MKLSRFHLIFLPILLLLTWHNLYAQEENTEANSVLTGLQGSIAYIGADYNVYNLNLENSEYTRLTSDAVLSQNALAIYVWPTWSTDNRLAYFRISVELGNNNVPIASSLTAFASDEDSILTARQLYEGSRESFQYAYWSPENCSGAGGCRNLAMLLSGRRNNTQGLFIELVRDDTLELSSRSIGLTQPPFYYSWSPDGTRMLWQRSLESIDVYDVAAGEISTTLSEKPGAFAAPAWSPIDDRLLFGVFEGDNQLTDLVIFANNRIQTLVPRLKGPIAFSWSPDGNKIAYIEQGGPVTVIDAVTGGTIVQGFASDVLAFFWSPDSRHLAYTTRASSTFSVALDLAPLPQGNIPDVLWSVLDVDTGTTHSYGAFTPTEEMWYLLQFFDQFAQSHRIWSPDSTHLIYSQVVSSNQPIISILDTSQTDSVPFAIANGVIGIWSFN